MKRIWAAIPVAILAAFFAVYAAGAFDTPEKEHVVNVINATSSLTVGDELKTELTNGTNSDGPKHYVIDASDSPSMGGN